MSTSRIPIILFAILTACFFSGCAKTPEDHAQIAKTSGNHQNRSASVEALNDQALLFDVAAHSEDAATRVNATRKLTDQRLLADLAKTTQSGWVGPIALEKIQDPQVVASLAREAASEYTRLAAACRVDDQQTLAELASRSQESNIREKAITALTDQKALAAVAERDPVPRFAAQAVSKLTDQAVLAAFVKKLAGTSRISSALWKEAFAKLTDQSALAYLAQTAPDTQVRAEAMDRLTDQQILADIARGVENDPNQTTRLKALERISDEKLLLEIAKMKPTKSDPTGAVPIAAVGKITSQPELYDIAQNGDHIRAREVAVDKLTDPQLIVGIVKNNAAPNTLGDMLRRRALRRVTDQQLLSDIAQNDRDEYMRADATEKLIDQPVLAHLAKNDKNPSVRREAVKRLTDQQTLADIILKNDSEKIVQIALDRLNDSNQLAKVVTAASDKKIRLRAMGKISDQQVLATLVRQEGGSADLRMDALWRLTDKTVLAELAKTAPSELLRKAAASKLSAPPAADIASAPENIADLINAVKIVAIIRGDSISNLNVQLKKMTPYPLTVSIPAGTYFVCDNAAAQNMVATTDITRTLTGDSDSIFIPVACANQPKKIPTSNDGFSIGSLPNAGELKKLMTFLGQRSIPYPIKQAAVWIITDNADNRSLGSLRTQSQNTPHFPGAMQGVRTIKSADAAAAMRLCAEAGIDIKKKNIWRDRMDIFMELDAGALKNWLKDFGEIIIPADKQEKSSA